LWFFIYIRENFIFEIKELCIEDLISEFLIIKNNSKIADVKKEIELINIIYLISNKLYAIPDNIGPLILTIDFIIELMELILIILFFETKFGIHDSIFTEKKALRLESKIEVK